MKQFIQNVDKHLHIEIDLLPEEGIDELPTKLWPFVWFFLRQFKWTLLGIALAEAAFAIVLSIMFWYVGELVEQQNYAAAMVWAGLSLLAVRLFIGTIAETLYHLVYTPYIGNLIRRQLYWYTARQSLSFFQNDFAGRIANKLLQCAPALRDALKSAAGGVWFATIFTISNLWFLAQINVWLAVPLFLWLVFYIVTLAYYLPILQQRSKEHADDMSTLTGQVVDGFTNFLPTKYFARTGYEDRRVIDLLRQHSFSMRKMLGTIWGMILVIDVLNTLLLIGTAAVGFWLINVSGQAGIAALAMALPMALQATFQSNWIMFEMAGIFENLGTVQEGMEIMSKKHDVVDRKDAKELKAGKNEASIRFENVAFHYGQTEKRVMEDFSLHIPAGQKVGLVGRSGAGKSTITSLIVRAFDVEGGQILIGDQNIADITQDSLRRHITVVTQDSYLFHRSVHENITYGKPEATMDEIVNAAKRANAHEFIEGLSDHHGRLAYEAHVGERGVKLSGGQRQRIGIARAILKDAPILVLDEATSALDSESEHAIQSALEGIMEGKTVIAIAHRLSTLRQMDRILVMDAGAIIEDGTHDELITKPDGHYAKLWQMQSGGFLKETGTEAA